MDQNEMQSAYKSTEPGFGCKASDFYEERRKDRDGVVRVGRRLADMTIPSMFPPEEYDTSQDTLAITNQSINAFLISSCMNALTLGALPPELPMCKIEPKEGKLDADIRGDPALLAEVEYALSRVEEKHRKRINTTNARTSYGRAMGHFLVTGNTLGLWTQIDNPRVYSMHHWVVERDAEGWPIGTCLKEEVSLAVVDEDVADAIRANRAAKSIRNEGKTPWGDRGIIFHCQKWCKEEDEWLYWQETEGGYIIPGTDFWSEREVPPMMPSGLMTETGSHYSLGYASIFEGDHQSMEELSASFKDGATALAWFLMFVNPTGQTDIRQVRGASNLDVLPGRADDVTALQTGKAGDLNFVAAGIENIARRLGQAYASEASIQRTGERVTAEEWRIMVQALDKAMGGLYSAIAQTWQRWFVKRFIYLHGKEDKQLSKLPKDLISIDVVTGIDGIGRSSEYENLMGLGRDLLSLFPKEFEGRAKVENWAQRLSAGRALKIEGLMKTDEEIGAETQQAQQAGLMDKVAGPMAQGGMDMLKEGMLQQQQAPTEGAANG